MSQSKLTIVYPNKVIYSDGAHNKVTGDEAWASVVDSRGTDLVAIHHSICQDMPTKEVDLPIGKRKVMVAKFNDVASQQNNGAELMALLFALRYACKFKTVQKVCTDSAVVLAWSKFLDPSRKGKMDPRKVKYIEELIALCKIFAERGGEVLKISGDDNLADLGYHR